MANENQPFPVVGVGASAGGIAALRELLHGVPERSGMAFVVITHLNPTRESSLPEILARHTQMRVCAASDGMAVAPDTVLVMPPGTVITSEDGHLRVVRQATPHPERKPIDVFLSSLAATHGEMAASIVLSGGDGDGSLGTQAMKEHGGFTLAQGADGMGPEHPEMPQSAVATGFVDLVAPASAMGQKLVEYFAHVGEFTALPLKTAPSATIDPTEAHDEIFAILRKQLGHDFSGYKRKTFLRRLGRRMQVNQIETIDAYIALLRESPHEVAALFRDLLINVTTFFRDAEAFEKLAETVIPQLFEGRGAQDSIRIWVPGCATGEEVYSLAILLREYMDQVAAVPRVQIFGTDIDDGSLAIARAARYPEALLESLSPERRRRFFRLDGSSYVLTKDIRELCVFSPHSVLRDPPFSRLDMVSCRNLLIYLGPDAQKQVIPVFHYALRPGGILLLGSAENVSQFTDLFTPIDKTVRIFRSRETGGQQRLPLLLTTLPFLSPRPAPERKPPSAASLRETVNFQVLEFHAPPHVVVNREGDIVHYSSRTGKYLEPPAGQPSRQLLSMARKELRLDLRTLLRDAIETNAQVRREGLAVEGDEGRIQPLSLTVRPLGVGGAEPLYLVLFEDVGASMTSEERRNAEAGTSDRTAALEQDLRETRDRLQSMVEEYETALEEIRSSNEELVSVNEELQSSNEELEASKEELQSLNEELHAVNAELLAKVEALDIANSDLVNLFESTEIATVFLDTQLAIRSFTPAATQIFSIRPGDYGRPITDLAGKLQLPNLAADIAAALEGQPKERRVRASDGDAAFLVRVTPYRGSAQTIDGVVASFVDISNLSAAEARQRLLIAELQHRTRNLLAVVRAISSQTLLTSSTIKEFETKFNDRLGALSRVQSLLSAVESEEITVGKLVRLEIEALNAEIDDRRVILGGDDVVISPLIVRTLALALHELVTNALKHGALATDKGTLRVTWGTEDNEIAPRLRLEWIETFDPPRDIADPPHSGFGRELIERALPYQLGAETEYRLAPEGVRCVLVIPLQNRST